MFNFLRNLFGNKKADVEYTESINEINNPIIEPFPMEEFEHVVVTPTQEEEIVLIPNESNVVIAVNTDMGPEAKVNEIDQVSITTIDDPYEPPLELRNYKYPTLALLDSPSEVTHDQAEFEANKNQIINTLESYEIYITEMMATIGPTVTLYEIVPAPGVRVSKIKNLQKEIALSLSVNNIQIIAPIPGRGTIGLEVPNRRRTIVSLISILCSEPFQYNNFALPVALGKKMDGSIFVEDLTLMPHLLIGGSTGQGKSVLLDSILLSLLYKKHPSQLKIVLIDPKKVEFNTYKTIELHFLAKLPREKESIIAEPRQTIATLNSVCIEMDNRFDLLKDAGTRNIKEYNEKYIKRQLNPLKGHQFLPFIIIVISEFADYISNFGKEVETPIARLAQAARSVGIHLIISTQRPSKDIITGVIKANFNARIAFRVPAQIDSRTILDTDGAEKLKGAGDMLFYHNGEITHLQGAYMTTAEVENVTYFIGEQRGYSQPFILPEYLDEREIEARSFDLNEKDPLFEDAARLIVQNQMGSTALLQRRMKFGYNRAGRLMDQLESAGIVGPNKGDKVRDVLIRTEHELDQHLSNII